MEHLTIAEPVGYPSGCRFAPWSAAPFRPTITTSSGSRIPHHRADTEFSCWPMPKAPPA